MPGGKNGTEPIETTGVGGPYRPPTDVLRFSAEYEAELNAASAKRMRQVGVPEEMIGIRGMPFEDAGAFVRTHAQGGGNLRAGTIPGIGAGINVDLAVLDTQYPPMSGVPSWSRASLKDRLDAVIAHEYTEALAPTTLAVGLPSHRHALQNAPDTSLNITLRAREILVEYHRAMTLE
jgi:hypothetical protein